MPNDFMSSDTVLQGLFIGVILAVLTVAYNKLIIGKFVKALIKAEANHPNFAKTFEQLGVKKNICLSLAMRTGSVLRKIVYEHGDSEKKGWYYIPEDKLYRAGRIYGGKDVDLLLVAAIILVAFIFFTLVLLYMPIIWSQVGGFLK
ncbi:MAG: hypothetical protein FWH10_03885 [Oscillospiraceae bacterium]|nr:hypothetical protein [Oscillospiraceae bacterium]